MKIMNPLEADEEWKRMKKIEETWLCLNHSGSFCYPSLKLGPLEHDMNFTLQIFPVLLCWPHLSGWTMEPDMATLPPGSDCSHMKNHVATHLCNTGLTHWKTLMNQFEKQKQQRKSENQHPWVNWGGSQVRVPAKQFPQDFQMGFQAARLQDPSHPSHPRWISSISSFFGPGRKSGQNDMQTKSSWPGHLAFHGIPQADKYYKYWYLCITEGYKKRVWVYCRA